MPGEMSPPSPRVAVQRDGDSQHEMNGSGQTLAEESVDSFPAAQAAFTLRPYQVAATEVVVVTWTGGVTATMIISAVGTRQTEMGPGRAGGRTQQRPARSRPLDGALHQADRAAPRAIYRHFPALAAIGVGIVEADQDECGAPVVIASVQTISQEARLDRLLANGAVTHLVIDEVHHGVAATYLRIVARMRDRNPHLRIVELSATPRTTAGPAGSVIFSSRAVGCALTPRVVAKSVRKAQAAIQSAGPDEVAVTLQGKLGAGDVLAEAGISAQPKGRRP